MLRRACLSLLIIACYGAQPSQADAQSIKVVTTDVGVEGQIGGGWINIQTTNTNKPAAMIVVLGGSEGGYLGPSSETVQTLLVNGFQVAPIAYHGATGTRKHLRDVPIEAVASRIETLASASGVGDGCVGLLGISKGGELALLLASYTDAADAYVANTPSHVVWQSSQIRLRRGSSWTLDGQPLAFVKYPRFSRATWTALRDVQKAGTLHQAALNRAKNLEAARIPVERARAPILLQAGTEDTLWPSASMSQTLLADMQSRDADVDISLKTYPLGHGLIDAVEVRRDAIAFLRTKLAATCVGIAPDR